MPPFPFSFGAAAQGNYLPRRNPAEEMDGPQGYGGMNLLGGNGQDPSVLAQNLLSFQQSLGTPGTNASPAVNLLGPPAGGYQAPSYAPTSFMGNKSAFSAPLPTQAPAPTANPAGGYVPGSTISDADLAAANAGLPPGVAPRTKADLEEERYGKDKANAISYAGSIAQGQTLPDFVQESMRRLAAVGIPLSG